METNQTKYFGVVGNRDYIKIEGERVPFWEFLDVLPDGWLTSLAYHREDVPADRPQIWDCGAWSYKDKDKPKLGGEKVTPEWALKQYKAHAAENAFVIAPDHMLIKGVDLDARRRFNANSAKTFLPLAQDAGFRPMAAIHGMERDERIEHAKQLIDLGYEALALGGVAARASQRRRVIDSVKAIREETGDAWLHVLGLSAPSYIEAWDQIGVDSCDGASHFKKAFTAGVFYVLENGRLKSKKAARVSSETKEPVEELPDVSCNCKACRILRSEDVDTRTYGTNEHNMGRAAHNLNMLMQAHRAQRSDTVYLVACVGEKKRQATRAKALYQSQWFRFARQYVELKGEEWNILSAEHGLLDPEAVVEPYNVSLNDQGRSEREGWAEKVAQQIDNKYETPTRFVFLAGRKYREHLIPKLHQQGHVCEVPMRGLGIGEQLGWMKQNAIKQKDFFEEEQIAI